MSEVVKPKFEDLSPEQVNSLIAGRIMRTPLWQPVEGGEGGYAFVFNPFTSLDDCWEAEEKLWTTPMASPVLRKYEEFLEELVFNGTTLESALSHIEERNARNVKFMLHHATAQQKCEAMLRAIMEIQ